MQCEPSCITGKRPTWPKRDTRAKTTCTKTTFTRQINRWGFPTAWVSGYSRKFYTLFEIRNVVGGRQVRRGAASLLAQASYYATDESDTSVNI